MTDMIWYDMIWYGMIYNVYTHTHIYIYIYDMYDMYSICIVNYTCNIVHLISADWFHDFSCCDLCWLSWSSSLVSTCPAKAPTVKLVDEPFRSLGPQGIGCASAWRINMSLQASASQGSKLKNSRRYITYSSWHVHDIDWQSLTIIDLYWPID